MRIYMSGYSVFVDEEGRQYIEMNNVLEYDEIAVKRAKIEEIIKFVNDENSNGSFRYDILIDNLQELLGKEG